LGLENLGFKAPPCGRGSLLKHSLNQSALFQPIIFRPLRIIDYMLNLPKRYKFSKSQGRKADKSFHINKLIVY
jgi:hypothetical protein